MPSYMKLNIHGIDIVGIAIMILIISCLVWVLKNKYLESFIESFTFSFFDDASLTNILPSGTYSSPGM